MNNKISTLFHTDTTLGKIIFFICFYLSLWFLAYGVWTIGSWGIGFENLFFDFSLIKRFFVDVYSLLIYDFSIDLILGLMILFYFFLLIPAISFILVKKVVAPCLGIKQNYLLYLFNTIFILFSIWHFVSMAISTPFPNF